MPVSHATAIFTDSFDYPDGPLTTGSGGVWTTFSGTADQLQVSGGSIGLTFAQSEDVVRALGSSFTSGRIYYSLTTNVSVLPTATGSYFTHFSDGETGVGADFISRLYVKAGATPDTIQFGIRNSSSGGAEVFADQEFGLNQDLALVVRFDFTTLQSTLWINPTNEASPSTTDTSVFTFNGTTTGVLNGLNFRQAGGIGTSTIGILRTGTTFADVTPVPEPGTLALVGLGMVGLLYGIRRQSPA